MSSLVACSSCSTVDDATFQLACIHSVCNQCLQRYILGSLTELRSFLRCCICGTQTPLIEEDRYYDVALAFGRHVGPTLQVATALGVDGPTYVTVDNSTRRVYIVDAHGRIAHDFAFLHGSESTGGVAVTHENLIVVPLKTQRQCCLSYYTKSGLFVTSAYLPDAQSRVSDVCCTAEGEVIATDAGTGKVHVISDRKTLAQTWPVPKLLGEDHDSKPSSVACSPQGQLYIADADNNCIKVMDYRTGTVTFAFGCRGERPGQFRQPSGITIDEQNRVIVADRGNNRVQMFTPEGRFIRYIVRYRRGEDVYMAAEGVTHVTADVVAVRLTATKAVNACEIRLYDTRHVQW